MVKLPIKRDHAVTETSQNIIYSLSPAQVSEIVQHLLGYFSTSPQQATAQLKSLEAVISKLNHLLTEGERQELRRHITYMANEYGAMDERLETAIKKAL